MTYFLPLDVQNASLGPLHPLDRKASILIPPTPPTRPQGQKVSHFHYTREAFPRALSALSIAFCSLLTTGSL